MRRKIDVEAFARFFGKVDRSGSCWQWMGAVHGGHGKRSMYRCGSFWHRGKARSAYVWLWEQAFGKVPSGMQVNHQCGNSRCVRLGHMYLGTQAQNVKDLHAHGHANGKQRGGKIRRK